METVAADLITRLRNDPIDAGTAKLLESAANRIADLEIERDTLRHGLRLANERIADLTAAPVAQEPTDQQIVDTLARHGIGWGDERGVTAYPLDGEDAPVYIGAIREILAAAPVAQEPGWKLVPIEATVAMRNAPWDCTSLLIEPDGAGDVWDAMLAAAPTPPAQGERQP